MLSAAEIEEIVSKKGYKLAAGGSSVTVQKDAPSKRADVLTPDTDALRRKYDDPDGAFVSAPKTDNRPVAVGAERQVVKVVPSGTTGDRAARGKALVLDPKTKEILSSQG